MHFMELLDQLENRTPPQLPGDLSEAMVHFIHVW